MNSNFILSCESTVDIPYDYVTGRDISVLFYTYILDGAEYEDCMCRSSEELKEFYNKLHNGALPQTSQINEYKYYDYFKDLLQKGNVLHLAFGSGMTPSVDNAYKAVEKLKGEFPERKITVIDTTCSCSGYGLITDTAADLRDSGKSMEDIAKWVTDNAHFVHHQFFSTDLKYFKRSGRVSGVAATAASILGICPLMHLDYSGKIIAYSKVRGKKNAINATVDEVLKHAVNGKNYNGKCFISHSDSPEEAYELKKALVAAMPNLKGKIKTYEIGNIIASHCGPGTVAVYFMGDERAENGK